VSAPRVAAPLPERGDTYGRAFPRHAAPPRLLLLFRVQKKDCFFEGFTPCVEAMSSVSPPNSPGARLEAASV